MIELLPNPCHSLLSVLEPQTPPKPVNPRVINRKMNGPQSEDMEEPAKCRDERKVQREAKHAVIRTALEQGPATCSELAQRLGWQKRSVVATISYVRGIYAKKIAGKYVWHVMESK